MQSSYIRVALLLEFVLFFQGLIWIETHQLVHELIFNKILLQMDLIVINQGKLFTHFRLEFLKFFQINFGAS